MIRWLVALLLVLPMLAGATPKTASELDSAVATGVRKLDATHYEIRATVLDAILGHPLALGHGARIVVGITKDKPDGVKLYAIRPGSLYARLGFANGDALHTINGIELTDVDKMSAAIDELAVAKTFQLGLVRRGKPLVLSITVK